uniref:BZIP domain-containing protein n=1 Tax=Neogobius melanostomus TaxID=47308 RepID=A0A8C6TVB2_9GOBI
RGRDALIHAHGQETRCGDADRPGRRSGATLLLRSPSSRRDSGGSSSGRIEAGLLETDARHGGDRGRDRVSGHRRHPGLPAEGAKPQPGAEPGDGRLAQLQNASGQHTEEVSMKRQVRLMKNREAARECRRKKKEYVKCLENRVAVLENQNKTLIEELKALKDIYCHKTE